MYMTLTRRKREFTGGKHTRKQVGGGGEGRGKISAIYKKNTQRI